MRKRVMPILLLVIADTSRQQLSRQTLNSRDTCNRTNRHAHTNYVRIVPTKNSNRKGGSRAKGAGPKTKKKTGNSRKEEEEEEE